MSDAASPPPPPDGVPSQADPLIGTVLAGRYRIVRRLGSGAMGSVYLGEHLRFGRLDAIKVLQGGIAHDRDATERFLRGARNASAINHPNVCTVYDFGDTDDGHQFLAMEFVDGESLADILENQGPLSLRRGIEITRQIGEALDAAHHLGIVHRDLKPGNVMLVTGRDGRDIVKVVDFDIAKGSSDGEGAEVTRTGFVVGTPEYMSPEQLTGDPLDARSDVYSLALVFIRIITGRLPVRSSTTQNLMVERLTQEPLRIAEIAPALLVPPGVQAAVDAALERRREDRPASASAFTAALVRGARTSGEDGVRDAPVAAPAVGAARTGGAAPRSGAAVPATQIGSAPASGSGSRPTPGAASPVRRYAPFAVGGLVVVAAVVAALQFAGGDDAGGVEPAPGVAADAGQPAGPGDTGAGNDAANTPPGGGGGETRSPDTADPATRSPETGDRVATPPADRPGTESPTPTPPAPPVEADPTPALTAASARSLLERQLARLEPATFASVTDSALLVWNGGDLPGPVRALAAYVLAQRYGEEGLGSEALTWARRAVDLDPADESYRSFLRLLGGAP